MKTSNLSVEYVDHLGSDLSVVNAARVSFDKISDWEEIGNDGEVQLSDKDTKLINYLAKHHHWSPLAHTSITVRCKAPIFLARQLGKHQIGLVWNEVSRRYVDDEPEFYFPKEWRGRPVNAKQGSTGVVEDNDMFHSIAVETCKENLAVYNNMIACGVAPEQARMILPQNMMTSWVWTGSLVAFTRILKLRLDPHAQQEAQDFAKLLQQSIEHCYPVSFKALMNT